MHVATCMQLVVIYLRARSYGYMAGELYSTRLLLVYHSSTPRVGLEEEN